MTFDRDQAILYTFFSVTYSLLGIPANSLSLAFFVTGDETDNISRYIFILLNSTDLFIGLCFVYLSVSYVSLLNGGNVMESPMYCSVMLAAFPTAQQLSVFITAVHCVVRTVSVVKPFVRIRRRVTFAVIFVYFLLIVGRVFTLFRNATLRPGFRARELRCGWVDVETGTLADFAFVSVLIISLILTPSILGCIITIVRLQRPSTRFPITPTKRKATITVMILTLICVISTSLFVVERVVRIRGGAVSPLVENMALQFAYSFTCIANPAVYIIRIKRMQKFVKDMFRRVVRRKEAST